jgi:hypothetical protein
MKNKFLNYIAFIIFLTVIITLPTLSYFNKGVESEVNILKTGEWIPAETLVELSHTSELNNQEKKYYNTENVFSYVDQENELYQITLEDQKNQFLSFSYKIDSQETAKLFDSPAVEVFIGDVKISQILSGSFDGKWETSSVDLSFIGLNTGIHDLTFVANNTIDDLFPPKLSIKDVTTKKIYTKTGDKFNFYPNKKVYKLTVEYKVLENNTQVLIQKEISPQYKDDVEYFELYVPSNITSNEFSYWSTDLFNNIEQKKFMSMNNSINLEISDFQFSNYLESDDEINIQTKYQNLSTNSKFYLSKVSENEITSQSDWGSAEIINQKQHHQFIDNDLQNSNGLTKVENNLLFKKNSTNKNYFTLKLCNTNSVCDTVIENLYIE